MRLWSDTCHCCIMMRPPFFFGGWLQCVSKLSAYRCVVSKAWHLAVQKRKPITDTWHAETEESSSTRESFKMPNHWRKYRRVTFWSQFYNTNLTWMARAMSCDNKTTRGSIKDNHTSTRKEEAVKKGCYHAINAFCCSCFEDHATNKVCTAWSLSVLQLTWGKKNPTT